MAKKLIVGLGNIGKKYKGNRHNVGFLIVDRLRSTAYGECEWKIEKKFLAEVCSLKAVDGLLAKPQTMMNASGDAVKKLVGFYKVRMDDLWVIHDDLDITLEEYKIQKGRGPRIHNGLSSIYQELGTKDFWHVRVGIENRKKNISILGLKIKRREAGMDYVLQNFNDRERKIVDEVVEKVTRDLVLRIVD